MMKKQIILLFGLMVLGMNSILAQSEVLPNDSLPPIVLDGSRYKSFEGGFLLDMGSMIGTPVSVTPTLLPQQLSWQSIATMSDNAKDYNEIFRPDGNVTYGRGDYSPIYGNYRYGFSTHIPTMQSATFHLNNGLRITTYGEYNADGHKVYNPSALPWQRDNFNAGFEFKSENGNFSIGIGVERSRR